MSRMIAFVIPEQVSHDLDVVARSLNAEFGFHAGAVAAVAMREGLAAIRSGSRALIGNRSFENVADQIFREGSTVPYFGNKRLKP